MQRISAPFNMTGSVTGRVSHTRPNLAFISPSTGAKTAALIKSFKVTRATGRNATYEAIFGVAKRKAARTIKAKLSRLIDSLGLYDALVFERTARGLYEITKRPITMMQTQDEPSYSLRTMLALVSSAELHVHETDEDGRPLILSSAEP